MIYQGLTHLESDGSVSPRLAESIDVTSDGLTYTFRIKPSYWSDGTPLTAHDFEASWKRALEPTFPSSCVDILYPIKNAQAVKRGDLSPDALGVQAHNATTLVVTLETPAPYFLSLTSFATCFPTPGGRDQDGADTLITNGPFTLSEWKSDDTIRLIRNSRYEGPPPPLQGITIRLIKDEGTALALYEKGEIDYVGGMLSPLPLDSIEKVKQRPDYHKAPMGGTTFFSLNLNRPPFHNESIRRAFKHAVDRATLVTNVTQMDEEIANGPVSPVLKGRRHLTAGAHDPLYSPDIARDYFAKGCAELGISPEEFPSLTYHHFTSELQRKIAVAIQSQLAEVLGVRVQLRQSDLPLYHSLLSQKSFDIAQMSWIAQYPDQMNVLERFAFLDSRRNYSSWTSTIFQNFITQAAKERDMRVRDTLLEKAEQCIIDDTPIVSLYYYSLCYLQSPHLRDVEVSPLGEVLFDKAFITTEKVFGNSG